VTPGTYTITLSNGSNMGRHTVQAGRITYVGLFPVWLPKVRGNSNGWNSTVVVRNNSSTFTAQVNTTFFTTTGEVQQQRTDNIAPNAVASLPAPTPSGGFSGSAVAVSSEDVAVVLRDPDCLDRMSGRRRDWAARQFGPAARMLSDKTTCSLDRVAVHAVEIFPRLFGLGQPTSLGLVVSLGDLSNLQQQLRFAVGVKENLRLSKVSQGLRGLTPTDATLVTAELLKVSLQF
jgi:hypothetical protein